MSPDIWQELLQTVADCARVTRPEIERLIGSNADRRASMDSALEEPTGSSHIDESAWSLQSPSQSPRSLLSRSTADFKQVPPFLCVRFLQIVQICLLDVINAACKVKKGKFDFEDSYLLATEHDL